MYDIVSNIINHSWNTQYSGEQQYIYYICGSLIIVFSVVFIDLIRDIFRSFTRG